MKIGRKVIQIYEGAIDRKMFEISTFRQDIEKLFVSRQEYKDEWNDLMQSSLKLIMNALYGIQIKRG